MLKPVHRRFKGLGSLKNFIAKALRQLDELKPADTSEAVKIAAAKFTGARLMAELVEKTDFEARLKAVEAQRLLPEADEVQ